MGKLFSQLFEECDDTLTRDIRVVGDGDDLMRVLRRATVEWRLALHAITHEIVTVTNATHIKSARVIEIWESLAERFHGPSHHGHAR